MKVLREFFILMLLLDRFDCYQHENKGARELKLCLKWTFSLSWRSRDVVELRWPIDEWAEFWWDLSCFSLVNSTVTHGICTNCNGVLLSFNAWTKFKICPLITDICFSNVFLSKPLSFLNKSYNSLHSSRTKFMSDSLFKIKSLDSWENGIFACGSQAQW